MEKRLELTLLAPDGKMAIIQNGSPLFSGDAGSGPSNIRQYILENDWLDAIIQLSTDKFMNTGISTYIWVISKDKPSYKAGKVQLIDTSHCYKPRRKSIGNKKNDITDACRELIVQAYGELKIMLSMAINLVYIVKVRYLIQPSLAITR